MAFRRAVLFKGNKKIILESLETNCDHDYMEYFHKVPNSSQHIHTFRVTKLVSAFSIDLIEKVTKTQRLYYKTKINGGCDFINNPMLYKLFGESFQRMAVNSSLLRCPINPGVYYMRIDSPSSITPSIHSPGRFQFLVRTKATNSSQPFFLEMLWKYKIVYIK
ncbi:uncharacterized protein LOC108096490 [Drosophila ficusphila]|uniref:uncharacterized protein LOC108096490 n=1 Tax=Drosophila ficusphila TaxID=30025 RepID=UPI0007E8B261|nr:uncharacterized protein LOC108096490 [Drosophila ficusphila]